MSSAESQVGTGALDPFAAPVSVTLDFFAGLDRYSVMIHGFQDEREGDYRFIDEALAHGVYGLDSWLRHDWRGSIGQAPSFVTLRGWLGWKSDMYRDFDLPLELRGCRHLAFEATSLDQRPLSDIIDNHRWAPHIAWLDRMRRALG